MTSLGLYFNGGGDKETVSTNFHNCENPTRLAEADRPLQPTVFFRAQPPSYEDDERWDGLS